MLQKINQIFIQVLNISPNTDLTHAKYGDPANWDSIRHVELFIALQKNFKISFTADEITYLNTYKMLSEFILKKTTS